MDPLAMLDMERRSGVSNQEIDSFVAKVDAVTEAMEQIKNGTFDPLTCKVPGYKTPEQEELEAKERAKREQEQRERLEAMRLKEKQEEREDWWRRAKLRFEVPDDDDQQQEEQDGNEATAEANQKETADQWANRVVASYKSRDANDYSQWAHWEPQDPVTQEEKAQHEALLQKMQNEEFEKNNPEFCAQFQQDLEQRARSQQQREQEAEKFKTKGNQMYKRRKYKEAVKNYMKALQKCPFDERILTNIAQSYLRLDQEEDSLEFSTRALFVNPRHVKALSRRAAVLYRQQRLQEAARDMDKAISIEPDNEDLREQFSVIVGDYEDSCVSDQLAQQMRQHDPSKAQENSELRFMTEVLEQMNRSFKQDEAQGQIQGDAKPSALADPCVAYELLVPFLSRTTNVRAFFRTSGELQRLLDRIIAATSGISKEMTVENQEPHQLANEEQQRDIHAPRSPRKIPKDTNTEALCSMLECALAAVRHDPRNQVIAFRQQGFQPTLFDGILSPLTAWENAGWTMSERAYLTIRLLWLRLLEALMETKSWKQKVLSDGRVLNVLLSMMSLVTNNAKATEIKKLSKTHHEVATLSASLVFTLSGDENSTGIKAMSSLVGCQPVWAQCLDALDMKLNQPRQVDMRCDLEENALGILVNFSTEPALREELQSHELQTQRKHTVKSLLEVCNRQGQKAKSCVGCCSCCCERALAVLLNMSISTDPPSTFREELAVQHAISTVQLLLSHTAAKLNVFETQQLFLSRATSLLGRLHSVAADATSALKPKDQVMVAKACRKQMTSLKLVQTLVKPVLQMANKQLDQLSCGPTSKDGQDEALTWQLLTQVWCHLGWCVTQDSSIRVWLRGQPQERLPNVLRLAFEFLTRSITTSSLRAKLPKEQAAGNMVKFLIAMHHDQDANDLKVLLQEANLRVLVNCLQHLPDGLARKNVAILLAKLCKQDPHAKEIIRSLRGIEMMMSLSVSQKTIQAMGLPKQNAQAF